MSIAQAQKQRELEQRLIGLENKMAELKDELPLVLMLVKDLCNRVEAIENRPRPGRPPKDSP